MLYRMIATLLALGLVAVCDSASAQVKTGTEVRWYRVWVDDATFEIRRRNADPPCGYGGSMKETLKSYDYMVSSASPEIDWTMYTDVSESCPNWYAPRIHLHAIWRPTFLEPAPGQPKPEDFVDLKVQYIMDEIQCPDGECDWHERVDAQISIKEFIEVGSQEIPEQRETFTLDNHFGMPDPFDGEMFIKVKVERVFPED